MLCRATALSVHGYSCEVMEKAEGDGYVPQTQKYLALWSEDKISYKKKALWKLMQSWMWKLKFSQVLSWDVKKRIESQLLISYLWEIH